VLWGASAQKKRAMIDPRHPIIESPHPSPLSARKGFFGSRPFSRVNVELIALGRPGITWCMTDSEHPATG
jgi:uracil-DNA glycosylase